MLASFRPPELPNLLDALKPEAATEKCASWNLGALLLLLLTGEVPFSLSSEVQFKHLARAQGRASQVRHRLGGLYQLLLIW